MGPFYTLISYTHTQMNRTICIIGSKEFTLGMIASVLLIGSVSYGGGRLMAAMTPDPTPQQKAAAVIKEAQQEKDANQRAYDAYKAAQALQEQALACVQSGDCGPFIVGTPSAE